MADAKLIEAEWNQLAWGNYETNLEFLRRVGFTTGALRVLEIGCGKGAILEHLRRTGYVVSGIDVDAAAIAHCVATCPGISAQVAGGENLPFDDSSFDAVLSFDVFEHIADSDRHLSEVRRVLKPRGCYLLQTPNKWTNIPFELLRQTRKFHTGPIQSYREIVKDHCALHNYWELQRRFARNGYELSFVDVPIVNDYFRSKMRTYLGSFGPWVLTVLNPDRFPRFLRTNFYAKAVAQ
jgi:SAM-dependent methyltransferase